MDSVKKPGKYFLQNELWGCGLMWEVTEDMIENVCMIIPHDSTYVILDMEWKELDSNLKLVYVYK